MRAILLIAAVLVTSAAFSQSVIIKKVELAGENVIVHYELDDSNPNDEYMINLYSSKDNFSSPLTKVSGDVGMEVKPGTDKKIIWKIRDEYGGYKGKIALEIRGKVYVPFAKLLGFDTNRKYKKGTTVALKWKAAGSNPINIELYKGGERVGGDMSVPNNGSHSLYIPKHAKKGKDYRLKISDSRVPEEQYFTGNFKVASKFPIVAVGVGVAAVALVAVLVTSKKSTSDGKSDIPDPASPPQIP